MTDPFSSISPPSDHALSNEPRPPDISPNEGTGGLDAPRRTERRSWADINERDLAPNRAYGDPSVTIRRVYEMLSTLQSKGIDEPELRTATLLTEGLLAGFNLAKTVGAAFPPLTATTQPPQPRQSDLRSYANVAGSVRSPPRMTQGTPMSEAQKKKQAALKALKALKPMTYVTERQMYLSPVQEQDRHCRRSYYEFRKQWERWATLHDGSIEFMKGLQSGDYMIQFSSKSYEFVKSQYFRAIDLGDWGSWKPRPNNADTSFPSAVLEGVDSSIPSEEVVKEVKKNADILGISEEAMKDAPISYVRFHRKTAMGFGPANNGRLIGPDDIIKAIIRREGIFLGALPVFARPFSLARRTDQTAQSPQRAGPSTLAQPTNDQMDSTPIAPTLGKRSQPELSGRGKPAYETSDYESADSGSEKGPDLAEIIPQSQGVQTRAQQRRTSSAKQQ